MNKQDRYDSLYQFYGEQFSVDWKLLKAQVKQESNFNPDAKSWCNALGLSQFMKKTWEEWKDTTPGIQQPVVSPVEPPPDLDLVLLDPRDPEDAIRSQAALMNWLLKQFSGDIQLSLASYNCGIGRTKKLCSIHGFKYENIIPHLPNETVKYVSNILYFYEAYKQN